MDYEKPLINILIRTSNRPLGFKKALDSIVNQSYPNIRIIISVDNDAALRYIPKGLEVIRVQKHPEFEFGYDLYLEDLKALVTDGYIIAIDDDDWLCSNTILSEMPLTGLGFICQLKRGNVIVPHSKNFSVRQIGFPCIVFHHSIKDLAKISPHGAGDSYFIKEILSKVDLPFWPNIVVYSPFRGFGKCNG